MKDKDSQLIAEAYSQIDEGMLGNVAKAGAGAVGSLAKGTGKAVKAAAPAIGKAAGKVGLAGVGVAAKTAGIGLEGIIKALNFLSAEQLKKVGDAALKKAAENEEYEQDDNDQYAPEEAPADDQLGEMEPLDDEDEERCPVTGKLRKKEDEEDENDLTSVESSLNDIANELKTLNQYVDFLTTGSRAQGFTGGVPKK